MFTSDSGLQESVISELRWDPEVNIANIGVSAHRGTVTLTGHVATYAERTAAERAAKRVIGVHAVANDIQVRLPESGQRDDTDIANAIVRGFEDNVHVPRDRIQVVVRNGWVTLDGEVQWDYQRRTAGHIAGDIHGVVGLTNSIRVAPAQATHDLQRAIRSALHRRADIDARNINVAVDGGEVELTGTVSSWTEIEAARQAAASAPGVRHVKSSLRIGTVDKA